MSHTYSPLQQGYIINIINKLFTEMLGTFLISYTYTLFTQNTYLIVEVPSSSFSDWALVFEEGDPKKEQGDHWHFNNCTTSSRYYLNHFYLYITNIYYYDAFISSNIEHFFKFAITIIDCLNVSEININNWIDGREESKNIVTLKQKRRNL